MLIPSTGYPRSRTTGSQLPGVASGSSRPNCIEPDHACLPLKLRCRPRRLDSFRGLTTVGCHFPASTPHFPVVAIILKEIPGCAGGKTAWTQLDSREGYLDIIDAARRVAISEGLSLPEWELLRYRRR